MLNISEDISNLHEHFGTSHFDNSFDIFNFSFFSKSELEEWRVMLTAISIKLK